MEIRLIIWQLYQADYKLKQSRTDDEMIVIEQKFWQRLHYFLKFTL